MALAVLQGEARIGEGGVEIALAQRIHLVIGIQGAIALSAAGPETEQVVRLLRRLARIIDVAQVDAVVDAERGNRTRDPPGDRVAVPDPAAPVAEDRQGGPLGHAHPGGGRGKRALVVEVVVEPGDEGLGPADVEHLVLADAEYLAVGQHRRRDTQFRLEVFQAGDIRVVTGQQALHVLLQRILQQRAHQGEFRWLGCKRLGGAGQGLGMAPENLSDPGHLLGAGPLLEPGPGLPEPLLNIALCWLRHDILPDVNISNRRSCRSRHATTRRGDGYARLRPAVHPRRRTPAPGYPPPRR